MELIFLNISSLYIINMLFKVTAWINAVWDLYPGRNVFRECVSGQSWNRFFHFSGYIVDASSQPQFTIQC